MADRLEDLGSLSPKAKHWWEKEIEAMAQTGDPLRLTSI